MNGVSFDRRGLGMQKYQIDSDIMKGFISNDENLSYELHAMSLQCQNDWINIKEFCLPTAIHWKKIIYEWSPEVLKFYLNSIQNTLPDPSNLKRWNLNINDRCHFCGVQPCTSKHILVGCKKALDNGKYSFRHDKVLEVIREAASLAIARSIKGTTSQNRDEIRFIKPGQKCKKSIKKRISIIHKANDWNIQMDTREKQCLLPGEICVSSLRPDLTLYSLSLKRVIFIELTVPWETNIPKDHQFKLNKYKELVDLAIRNGFSTSLYAVEIGARGLPAKSIYSLLKDLGLPRNKIKEYLDRMTKAALTASYWIWLRREGEH